MYSFLNDWVSKKRWASIFILSRYLYRVGEEPLISDAMYDQLTKAIRSSNNEEMLCYLDRTYDDDPIPYDLLEEAQIEPVKFVPHEGRKALYAQLDEEKSLSINSVTTYEEAYIFFMHFKTLNKDLVISLKMDGINTKMLYVNDKFGVSVSRARDGVGFDFTDQLANVVPLEIKTGKTEIKITGESYVIKSGIPILRDKYDSNKYKTSKSSAISMLRVAHAPTDYKYLKTRVFSAEGLCDTLCGTYRALESLGFDTVPYCYITIDEVPSDFIFFKSWLKSHFDSLYKIQVDNDIPADGIVVAVNDLLWDDTITNQYSNKQLALKFEHWKFDVYRAVVTDILTEQRRVNVSTKVRIAPLVTSDDCEARIINTFNPAVLIENNIKVGTEVFFERNSGAVNILIHGKRLEDILKE